jgi:hypothetical protein
VVVAFLQRELQLDSSEERRRRMEHEAVLAGVEAGGELRDPPVVVRLAGSDRLAAMEELDADAARGCALAGVEDVGRERDAHGRNLRA